MINSIIISADLQNWTKVYNFIVQYFLKYNIPKKDILCILVSAEEIFCNIIYHSKIESESNIEIYADYACFSKAMKLKFKYEGIKFNPCKTDIPDVKISLANRQPGGLGLLIVKKFTDSITYRHLQGKNVLEVSKKAINF